MTALHLLPDFERLEESTGTGVLTSDGGNLPLVAMTIDADITALVAGMVVCQTFRNPHRSPVEATYIFPLPDRAAVTGFEVTIGTRHITGVLEERQAARDTYDAALAAGQRAAILEQDRPDVFTTRIGNLAAGEEATITLTLAGPVDWEFGEATFRVPLVVAPRYIPGQPVDGAGAGLGAALDTDAVPDASRITPPVLLPGSPNPVRLKVVVRLDPAGLTVTDLRSSLHAVTVAGALPGPVTVELRPGERLDRDFVLRYRVADGDRSQMTAVATPDGGEIDGEGDGLGDGEGDGTLVVTMLPPAGVAASVARDVVLVVDRSGSMGGWKMVAARRAAARIVDSLTSADRFGVLAFDHAIERPPGFAIDSLVAASDRNRYRAVEWLSRLEARGGTELTAALATAATMLQAPPSGDCERARATIVVTDGQVGNEDELVRLATAGGGRMFCVGIDRAVNAGLLRRLAAATGGRCDLVESEDRLDDVLSDLQRRIGQPLVEAVALTCDAMTVARASVVPARPPDLYLGVALVVSARYRGRPGGQVTLRGHDGVAHTCPVTVAPAPAAEAIWARAHLRDLEDRYAAGPVLLGAERDDLAARIVAVSRRHRVLCRFTAWVAIDDSGDVVERSRQQIVQPVEMPAGWKAWAGAPVAMMAAPMGAVYAGGPPPPPTPPVPPASLPPIRAMIPTAQVVPQPPRPGSTRTRFEAVTVPVMVSEAAYRPRLEQLLAAIDRLGDPSDPDNIQAIAAAARLLAGDIASVVAGSRWVDQLEALAAALDGGQPAMIAAAVARLRTALDGDAQTAGPPVRRFWR